jgi:hypothetical protein
MIANEKGDLLFEFERARAEANELGHPFALAEHLAPDRRAFGMAPFDSVTL